MYSYPNYYPRPALKGRPVTSLDEVRVTPIDFDGSVFYFPDVANKRIYTKQINPDGTAALNMYELKDAPVELTTANPSYVTREEFEKALEKLAGMIQPPAAPQQPQPAQPTLNF